MSSRHARLASRASMPSDDARDILPEADLDGVEQETLRDQIWALAVLIATWTGLTVAFGAYRIPSPWGTLSRLTADVISGELLRHAMYTVSESVVGLFLGALPAVVLPLLLRRSPLATAVLDPFMVIGYGVPKLALAPLFLLWFGIGMASKVAVVAISSFFIVYFQMQAGLAAVNGRLVETSRVLGATERDLVRYIVLPATMPYLFAGVRIALPYSVGSAVVTELISANRGLGYLVQFGAVSFDTAAVFVALTMVCFIVSAGNRIVAVAELQLMPYRRTTEAFHATGPFARVRRRLDGAPFSGLWKAR